MNTSNDRTKMLPPRKGFDPMIQVALLCSVFGLWSMQTQAVDLVASNVVGPESVLRGNMVSVQAVLQNYGPDSVWSLPEALGVYLSTDRTIETNDILVASLTIYSTVETRCTPMPFPEPPLCLPYPVPGLRPGIITWHAVALIPESIPPGTYHWGAIADYVNAVSELNEQNNSAAGGTVEIVAYQILKPIVVGTVLKFTFPTVSGRTFTVEYTDSLSPSEWKWLNAFIGDGTTKTVTTSTTRSQQRFYRLKVQ